MESVNDYNFNGQDYDVVVRLFNGVNDVYLTNTAWDNLILEEDIFNWSIKGSIAVNTPYDSLERESVESILSTGQQKEKLIYKFRNDCRDTLFISIKPKQEDLKGIPIDPTELSDKKWRIEIEAVIYSVEDLPHVNVTDKRKKLYFWEKTYQMMLEKDSEYSTGLAGSNQGKESIDQLDNSDRGLPSGESLGSLIKNDSDFSKHSLLVGTSEWDNGSDEMKIFYSSPVGAKFIDDLNYILNYTIATKQDNYQPCILKFERAEKSMQPKQFSLKPIKRYFDLAGNQLDAPKEYQIEHFFIKENSDSAKTPRISKTPLASDSKSEIKADEHSIIRGYQLVDLNGIDYSKNLANYRVVSFNSTQGQFNEESNRHNANQYKEFFDTTIRPSVLTNNKTDRLVFTPYIESGLNTKTIYSLRDTELFRLADGRNRMLKYYLFSNLAISFSTRGMTIRQPGRFFGLSKLDLNDKEFDHKLEGQYFVTSVIHHFSNTKRVYHNQLIGVKTHTFQEMSEFKSSDVILIS
jgi:hypothetical protein